MKKERIKIKGQIIEALPSLVFKVKLETGEEALTYLGGRMRRYQIKLLPGDDVLVELSPYDRKRGRIVYRY
ncbi:translation initiation factor IF-1 [Patescibacteria group bacterium]|nr:translation initiation factor IF-1 [Patescibacteria group bacterium]